MALFLLGMYLGGLIMSFVFIHILAKEKLDLFNLSLLIVYPFSILWVIISDWVLEKERKRREESERKPKTRF